MQRREFLQMSAVAALAATPEALAGRDVRSGSPGFTGDERRAGFS